MARGRGRPKKLPPTDREVMIRQFEGACLPMFLVDLDLNVTYSNPYAQEALHSMNLPDGLRSLLPVDSVEECLRRMEKGENFRIDLSPVKAVKLTLAFSPMADEDSDGRAAGAMVLVTYTEDRDLGGMEVVTNSGVAALSSGLRQPLSEIFASMAVLGRRLHVSGDHQYDAYLNDLNRAAYRLLRNAGNLVSRLRSCTDYRPPTEVVDFWERMAELLDACAVALQGQEIPFSYELPRDGAHVECCFTEIAEAVMNLISNSYRHTRPGNAVTVTGKNGQSGGVVVTVADKGRGIPPEDLDWIFSPYYSRGKAGEPFVGLGMGLNVARQNIYANGGTMAVNSTPRVGTTVAFTLPTTEAPLTPRHALESGSAPYLRDRFSQVYVGLCDVINLPDQ